MGAQQQRVKAWERRRASFPPPGTVLIVALVLLLMVCVDSGSAWSWGSVVDSSNKPKSEVEVKVNPLKKVSKEGGVKVIRITGGEITLTPKGSAVMDTTTAAAAAGKESLLPETGSPSPPHCSGTGSTGAEQAARLTVHLIKEVITGSIALSKYYHNRWEEQDNETKLYYLIRFVVFVMLLPCVLFKSPLWKNKKTSETATPPLPKKKKKKDTSGSWDTDSDFKDTFLNAGNRSSSSEPEWVFKSHSSPPSPKNDEVCQWSLLEVVVLLALFTISPLFGILFAYMKCLCCLEDSLSSSSSNSSS